jgi:hypothetical protein
MRTRLPIVLSATALAVAVLGAVQASTGGFGAVFAVAAAITVAVWFVGYLLIDRRPALDAAAVAVESARS